MELKRITEERLQAMALLSEAEWTAEEREIVVNQPEYRAEIDAYQLLFEGLGGVDVPELGADFESRVLASLPEPQTEIALRKSTVPTWLQWTGLGVAASGIAAATVFMMPRPTASPRIASVDFSASQTAFQQIMGLLEGNGLLIASGIVAIIGTALLDKALRKRGNTRFGM